MTKTLAPLIPESTRTSDQRPNRNRKVQCVRHSWDPYSVSHPQLAEMLHRAHCHSSFKAQLSHADRHGHLEETVDLLVSSLQISFAPPHQMMSVGRLITSKPARIKPSRLPRPRKQKMLAFLPTLDDHKETLSGIRMVLFSHVLSLVRTMPENEEVTKKHVVPNASLQDRLKTHSHAFYFRSTRELHEVVQEALGTIPHYLRLTRGFLHRVNQIDTSRTPPATT